MQLWHRPEEDERAFCYFTFAKAHLSLGFYYGVELDDPEGLLQGSGKKFESKQQLKLPAVRTLIEQASAHRVPPLPA